MKKLNKKGFTLVELLAVIAILAILMLLVTPNILKLFTEGRKDAFVTQCQSIWKMASQQYITEAVDPDGTPGPYCSEGSAKLDYDGDEKLKYYVSVDASKGTISKILVTDGTYYFDSTGQEPLTINTLNSKNVKDVPKDKTAGISCDADGKITGLDS